MNSQEIDRISKLSCQDAAKEFCALLTSTKFCVDEPIEDDLERAKLLCVKSVPVGPWSAVSLAFIHITNAIMFPCNRKHHLEIALQAFRLAIWEQVLGGKTS